MVGVARYVWRNNSQPKLVALLPKIKAEHKVITADTATNTTATAITLLLLQ